VAVYLQGALKPRVAWRCLLLFRFVCFSCGKVEREREREREREKERERERREEE
jgi:hypothetical protein